MRTETKAFFLILIVMAALALPADDVNSDFFVKHPQGVRAGGMGNAFTAVSGDPLSTFWNPSGISRVREMTLSSSHAQKFGNFLSDNYLVYLYPLMKHGTIGLTYFEQTMDEIMVPGDTPDDMRFITDTQRNVGLSYGYQPSERWLVGFNLKHLSEKNVISASAFECDAGLIYKGKRYLDFGLTVADWAPSNFTWTTGRAESIPATLRTGVLYHSPRDRFRVSMDGEFIASRDSTFRLGSEYDINSLICVRGGMESNSDTGWVPALGFTLDHENWTFDYTWTDSDIGSSSFFGATIRFDHPRKKDRLPRSEELIGSELSEIRKEVREETIQEQKNESTMDEIMARYSRPKYVYEEAENARTEEPEEAVSEATLNPEASEHFELGNVYLLRKMYTKAIEEYLKVIELEPNFAKVHFNLAAIYQKIDMDEKAIYEYRYVLKLQPDNLNALLALGNLYNNKGLADKAVIYYNRVIVLSPHSLQADVARKRLANL